MTDWIVAHQPQLRLGVFLALLVVLLTAEALWPRRAGPMFRNLRWVANFAMVVAGWAAVRLLIPLGAAAGTAMLAHARGIGLLNQVSWPPLAEGVLAFAVLDCAIYWQHRLFHRLPWFWRLHRMHHSDVEFDTTTALRFHPAEIWVSMLIKMGVIVLLGAPVAAVIAFEIALNGAAMFNHANLRLPDAFDRALRRVLVTPDMHRVHHSTHRREHDSNYGFTVSWWDYLFRSYTDQPVDGHTAMKIGLGAFREESDQRLWPLLAQPVRPLGPERSPPST